MKRLPECSYIGFLVLLFIASYFLKPLMPIDETRYMSVAWEMFLQKNYFVLSLNFEPYHHKPPFLFWMINLMWNIFGVSRWAGLIPIFVASLSVTLLTKKLAEILLPDRENITKLIPWLMMGSVPFLIYSTLVMFDMMLTVCVLLTLVLFLSYAWNGKLFLPLLAGLCMGAGVLVKGPVMYLYILWPLLLYPFWRAEGHAATAPKFYLSVFLAVCVSSIPVLLWLAPTLRQTDGDFAFWLLWKQTTGRITGNFSSSHARPVFYYFTIMPVLFLPWALYPRLYKNIKSIDIHAWPFKFLAAATIPVFISFSLIVGKQPHYLLPLLPSAIILVAYTMEAVNLQKVRNAALWMLVLTISLLIGASQTLFRNFHLETLAPIYQENSDRDWAFVHKYQGELGFVARVEKHIDSIDLKDLPEWFKNHPDGFAFVRYGPDNDLEAYEEVMSIPYRGKDMGVFKKSGKI